MRGREPDPTESSGRRAPGLAWLGFVALAAAACGETTAPDPSEFRPVEAVYRFQLTACAGCPDDAPPFARTWEDGVFARIEISDVTGETARGEYLTLQNSAGTSLLGLLASRELEFARDGVVYASTDDFAEGSITVTLQAQGCGFALTYPGVDTGEGICQPT